jgi:hypothetical protein
VTLDERLREGGARLRAATEALDVPADVVAAIREAERTPPRVPLRERTWVLVAAASAAAAALVAGLLVTVGSGSSTGDRTRISIETTPGTTVPEPTTDAAASTTAPTTTTTSTTSTAPTTTAATVRVTAPPATAPEDAVTGLTGQPSQALVHDGTYWMETNQNGLHSLFRSADGHAWDLVLRDDVPGPVAIGDGGMVAAGGVAGLQRSDDGTAWEQMAFAPDIAESASSTGWVSTDHQLAWGPAGYVAVMAPAPVGAGPIRFLHSADGVTWDSAFTPPGPQLYPGGPDRVFAFAGGFAIPGGYGSRSATLYLSADGRSWSTVDLSGTFGGEGADLADWDGRLVAISHPAPGATSAPRAVWVSTDGRAWTRLADPPFPDGDPNWDAGSFEVAAGPAGIVAVSTSETWVGPGPMPQNPPFPSSDLPVWFSPDGVTWRAIGTPWILQAVAVGDTVVLGGASFTDGPAGVMPDVRVGVPAPARG